jgi:hypothetical protein
VTPGSSTGTSARTTLTSSDFERHLVGLRAWLNEHASHDETMATFLVKLLESDEPWVDEALLELLRGDHGDDLQQEALLTIRGGLGCEGNSYRRSFVSVCVQFDRLALLQRVADMGLPPGLKLLEGCGALATNLAGRWLDTLASSDKRVFSGDGLRDFPSCVDVFSAKPAAEVLADILVRHDPNHKAVSRLHGTAGYGIIMAALMRNSFAVTAEHEAALTRARNRRAEL